MQFTETETKSRKVNSPRSDGSWEFPPKNRRYSQSRKRKILKMESFEYFIFNIIYKSENMPN